MSSWQQRFEIIALPHDPTQANQLSIQVTQLHGSKGWQVVAAVPLGMQMLLIMQKPL